MSGPVRADHRYIKRMCDIMFGGKVTADPAAYNKVSRVFKAAGGSWERVFDGSTEDNDLLKKTLRAAKKKGVLKESAKWLGDAAKKTKDQAS